MGVWSKLNRNVGDLLTSNSGTGGELVSSGTIFGGAALIGLANIVLLTALPTHFYLSALQSDGDLHWVRMWLFAGTASACAVGLIATLVPMAIGLRAFRALEF